MSARSLPRAIVSLLTATAMLTACGSDTTTPAPTQNIVQLAQATPTLSTLTSALTAASLTTPLTATGPFTVFAPSNSAFAALPSAQLNVLLQPSNIVLLQKVLKYHVVAGRYLASQLTEGQKLVTLAGDTLTIHLSGGARVNNANIVTTNVLATNGVVHIIDGVLTDNLDIVDVATLRGFSSLVSAVQAAGLESALRGNGTGTGLTVFAPTNAAFTALGTLPTNPTLSSVLTYHVVAGTALAASLSNNQQLTTLQGGQLRVLISGSSIRIQGNTNTVNVIATDVPAKNGVIHAIDAVLIP